MKWIRILFIVSGLYDGLLGLAFLVAPSRIFERMEIAPPNHAAYITFPALILVLFGVLFLRIAQHPVRYREMMLFGVGLKVAYAGTVLGYAATSGIPSLWITFAWCDIAFLILFLVAWVRTGREA